MPKISAQVATSVQDARANLPENVQKPVDTLFPQTPSPIPEGDQVKLWAGQAIASSNFGTKGLNAEQATKPWNTYFCGRMFYGWQSKLDNTIEWLELSYSEQLYLTKITIYESLNPGQIVKVETVEPDGTYHEVYTAIPVDLRETCPHKTIIVWSVPLPYPTNKVRVTVDQSVLGIGYAQIDAVEIQGIRK